MAETFEKANRSGKWIGVYSDNVETALEYRKLGASYLAVSIDASIFLRSARSMVSTLKRDPP